MCFENVDSKTFFGNCKLFNKKLLLPYKSEEPHETFITNRPQTHASKNVKKFADKASKADFWSFHLVYLRKSRHWNKNSCFFQHMKQVIFKDCKKSSSESADNFCILPKYWAEDRGFATAISEKPHGPFIIYKRHEHLITLNISFSIFHLEHSRMNAFM